ncbi:MAG: hypothetical protein ACLP1X_15730 [Polyangiaceae bacterium]
MGSADSSGGEMAAEGSTRATSSGGGEVSPSGTGSGGPLNCAGGSPSGGGSSGGSCNGAPSPCVSAYTGSSGGVWSSGKRELGRVERGKQHQRRLRRWVTTDATVNHAQSMLRAAHDEVGVGVLCTE